MSGWLRHGAVAALVVAIGVVLPAPPVWAAAEVVAAEVLASEVVAAESTTTTRPPNDGGLLSGDRGESTDAVSGVVGVVLAGFGVASLLGFGVFAARQAQ
ncbi:MAG: hypothetical protein AB7H43_11465, partial [Acidimicrobiia bacterium]